MNLSLETFTEEKISTFKNTELATIYNKFAAELVGVNQVKKFADKKSAIRRTTQIQEDYSYVVSQTEAAQEQAEKLGVAKKSPVKKKVIVKDDTKIHGLVKDDCLQIKPGTKIRPGTILFIISEALSYQGVYTIENIIDYLFSNAPKNPKRKPMTTAYAAEYIKWYINKGNLQNITEYNEDEE